MTYSSTEKGEGVITLSPEEHISLNLGQTVTKHTEDCISTARIVVKIIRPRLRRVYVTQGDLMSCETLRANGGYDHPLIHGQKVTDAEKCLAYVVGVRIGRPVKLNVGTLTRKRTGYYYQEPAALQNNARAAALAAEPTLFPGS
jgi:hypothetical protein